MNKPIEQSDHKQASPIERGSPMSTTTGYIRPMNSIWKGVWRFLGPPAPDERPPGGGSGRRLAFAVGYARLFALAYIIVLAGMAFCPAASYAIGTPSAPTVTWNDQGYNTGDTQKATVSKPGGSYDEWKVSSSNGTGTDTTDWMGSGTASWQDTVLSDKQTVKYKVQVRKWEEPGWPDDPYWDESSQSSWGQTTIDDRTAPDDPTAGTVQLTAGALSSEQNTISPNGFTAGNDNPGGVGGTYLQYRYRYNSANNWSSATTDTSYTGVDADGSTAYRIRARTFDSDGNYSGWVYATAVTSIDRTPPAVPSGETVVSNNTAALNSGVGIVVLDWNDNGEGDFNQYRIHVYKDGPAGTGTHIDDVTMGTSTKTLDLDDEVTYYFYLRSEDTIGNYSDWYGFAPTWTTTTPDRTRPSATTGFSATAVTDLGRLLPNADAGMVDLAWTNPAGGSNEYDHVDIRRNTGSYPGRTGGTALTGVSGATHTDTQSLDDLTQYYYKVWVYDAEGNWCTDGTAQEDLTTTDDRTPPGASTITATAETDLGEVPLNSETGQVNLTWTNPGDGDIDRYVIRRKTGSYPSSPTDGTEVHSGGGLNLVDDNSTAMLDDNNTYYYRIWVYDNTGNYSGYTGDTALTPDRTRPNITLSSDTHPNDTLWYKDNTPEFDWTVTDVGLAGLKQARYLVDNNAGTTAATVLSTGIDATADPGYTPSDWEIPDAMSDSAAVYFHLAAEDNAGGAGDGNYFVEHIKLKIDATSPSFTVDIDSQDHPIETADTWYQDDRPEFQWTSEDLGGVNASGIKRARYLMTYDSSLGATFTDEAQYVLNNGTVVSNSKAPWWGFPIDVGNGTLYFYVAVEDNADGAGGFGNVQLDHYILHIDDENPDFTTLISSSTHTENVWTSDDSPKFSWAVSDGTDRSGIGEVKYLFDTSGSRDKAYVLANGTALSPVANFESVTDWNSYTVPGPDLDDDTWYFYVAIKDNAVPEGVNPVNSDVESYLVRIDVNLPVVTVNNLTEPTIDWIDGSSNYWSNDDTQTVDVDFSETASMSGLKRIEYKIDSDAWGVVVANDLTNTYSYNSDFNIDLSGLAQGGHTVYFRAQDHALNWSSGSHNIVIYRDTQAPTMVGKLVHIDQADSSDGDNDSGGDGCAPDYSDPSNSYDDDGTVKIKFVETEDYSTGSGTSGRKRYLVDVDTASPSTEETGATHQWNSQNDDSHSYYARIEDMVGNLGTVGSVNVCVDTTLPTLSALSVTGDGIDSDWDRDGAGAVLDPATFNDGVSGSGFRRHLFQVGAAPAWSTIHYIEAVDGSYLWNADEGGNGQDITFHARSVDMAGNISAGSVTDILHVDEEDPIISDIDFPDQDDVEGHTRSGDHDNFGHRTYHGEDNGDTVRFQFTVSDNEQLRRASGSSTGPHGAIPSDEDPVSGESLVATLTGADPITGSYQVTITIYDSAGNSASLTEYWALDNTAPVPGSITLDPDVDGTGGDDVNPIYDPGGVGVWYDDPGVDFDWAAGSDANSGLPDDCYQVKNSAGQTVWTSTNGDASWQSGTSFDNLSTTAGNATPRTITLQLRDRVGNLATATATVYVDVAVPDLPVVTITPDGNDGTGEDDISPIYDPGGQGIFYDDTGVDLSWTAPSDTGGLRSTPYSVKSSSGSTTWSALQSAISYSNLTTDGGNGRTVYVRAVDKAGNARVGQNTVTVDTIPPTTDGVTVTGDGLDPEWDRDGANFTIDPGTFDDSSGSGFRTYYVAVNDTTPVSGGQAFTTDPYVWSYDVGGNGTYTIYVKAVDLAGNVQVTPVSDVMYVDQTSPVVTDISFPKADYGDGWDEIAQHAEKSGEAIQFEYTFTESDPHHAECNLVAPPETNPGDDNSPAQNNIFSITLGTTRDALYEATITLYDQAGNSGSRTEYWNLNTQTLSPYPSNDPAEIIYPVDQTEAKNNDLIDIYSEILGDHRLMDAFSVDLSNIQTGTGITEELNEDFEVAVQYDFNGGWDGWSVGGGISSSTAAADHIWLRLGSSSGYIQKSGLSIDADEHKLAELKMGAYTTNQGDGIVTGKISFTTNGTDWHQVTFSVPMESRQSPPEKFIHIISMSSSADWSGTVTGLRLYPFDAGSGREAFVDDLQVRNARYSIKNVQVAGTTGHADQIVTLKVGAK